MGERKEYFKKYYINNKDKYLNKAIKWQKENPDVVRRYGRERAAKNRIIVLKFYTKGSLSCECCGENCIHFLTIDHINGDGAKHRKEIKTPIYSWLIRNNFPNGFRVLCFNCNCAREKFDGVCPHKIKPTEVSEGFIP